jgi:hypothetical protein
MGIDLLEGEYMCCGALCDKRKAQCHIDKMQQLIDELAKLFVAPESEYKRLIQNLRLLHEDLK